MFLLTICLATKPGFGQDSFVPRGSQDQGFRAFQQSPLRIAKGLQESSNEQRPENETEDSGQQKLEPSSPTDNKSEVVTLGSIETELEKVNALPKSEDPIFGEIQSLYQKAKLQVTEANELRGSLAQFQDTIKSGPEQLEKAKLRLDQTTSESKLPINRDTPVDELPPLKELEAQKREREIQLKAINNRIETFSPVQRQTRVKAIQEQVAQAKSHLEEIELQLKTPSANDNEFFIRARRTQLLAESEMLRVKIKTFESESDSYDATVELPAVELEYNRRLATQLTKEIAVFDSAIHRLRQDKIDRLNSMAVATKGRVIEPLKKMAESNIRLTQRLRTAVQDIEKFSQQAAQIKKETVRIEREQTTMESRIDVVGLNDSFAQLLQRNRNHLIDAQHHQLPLDQLNREIADAQITAFGWDDETELITDVAASATEIVATLKEQGSLRQQQRENGTSSSQDLYEQQAFSDAQLLLKRRAAILAELKKIEEQRFQGLVAIKTAQMELASASIVYAELIDEHILWVRNAPSLGVSDFQDIGDASMRLASPANWQSVWDNLRGSFTRRFPTTALLLISSFALFLFQHRMVAELNRTGALAIKRGCRTFRITIFAFIQTLLLAATKLSPLLVLGVVLTRNVLGSQFSTSLGWAFVYTFLIVFPFELLSQSCRKNGLIHSHFNWSQGLRLLLKRNFDWTLPIVIPLLVVLLMLPMLGDESGDGHFNFDASAITNLINGGPVESGTANVVTDLTDAVSRNSFSQSENWNRLGRVLLLALLVIATIFSASVFHPKGALYADRDSGSSKQPQSKLRYLSYLVAIAIPLVLGAIAVFGYYYSAIRIGESIVKTIALAIVIIVLYSGAMRFLLVRRRNLRYEQLLHQRNQARLTAEQKDAAAAAGAASEVIEIDLQNEPGLDITDVSRQARELTAVIFLVVAGGILLSIWQYLLPATKIMDDIRLWDVQLAGKTEFVTLRDVMFSGIMFLLTYFGVRNMPGMLELLLLQRLPLDAGARYAVTSIFRYILLVIGAILALGYLKIPWSNYSWLVAAISVGLGFGLQEIVANFVSGLILLLERPVRVGDVVTIDGTTGVVSRIQMRATTVTNWDNQELVVPNKDLISGKLLNWTLSSVVNRLSLPFNVAYGSDPAFVRQIVLDAIASNRALLQEPKPMVTFEEFGDSSLNFTLRCCVSTIERRWQIVHELNATIYDILKEHNIEIPFPQRDLHIVDGSSPLEVTDENSNKTD